MPETRLFGVKEYYQKCLKLAGPRSRKNDKKSQVRGERKMPESRKSAVTEKCQKVAGPHARKNAKKSHVLGHGKRPEIPRSAVTDKYKKCIGQQLCKTA